MDIDVTSGDHLTFDVYNTRFNEITQTDEPVNLTGAKIWFTVKRTKRDADVDALILKDSVTNPTKVRVVGDPLDGIIRISLDPSDTDSLKGSLPYDVQVKESDGTITTIIKGYLQVSEDITISTA